MNEEEPAVNKPWRWNAENSDYSQARIQLGLEILRSAFHSSELTEILTHQRQPFCGSLQMPIRGNEIPIASRILALANAYDIMTSDLTANPISHEKATTELRKMAGIELDPDLVERFIESPGGWRPNLYSIHSTIEDRQAVMLGYQLERVLHSFHARNLVVLKSRLQSLTKLAQNIDMPGLDFLILQLTNESERKAISDWDSLLPMLKDLIEMCMTIQRAYLRNTNAADTQRTQVSK
jgi:hypothetical protein